MTIAIDPEGGFIKEEEQPVLHKWTMTNQICEVCGMTTKFYVETDTPCKEPD